MTVVCFGEILIDHLVALTGDHEDLPSGAPANVAVALARLGLATAFVGAVGEDEPGQPLTHLLIEAGVNCDGLQPRHGPTRPASSKSMLTAGRSHLWRVHRWRDD